MRDLTYLKLLAREYPSVKAASSEIINLMAICGLPKGTEYFFSDLHGEYEAFIHLLRSASGIIREKIRDGMPTIAECGGFMYLHETLKDKEGRKFPMTGVIPGVCSYRGKLVRFGYVELAEKEENFLPIS